MIPTELHMEFCKAPPQGGERNDIEAWRAFRDQQRAALDQLDAILRRQDEAELARMQAQMSALQARLGKPPVHTTGFIQQAETIRPGAAVTVNLPKPRPEIDADGIVARPSYADTDAGMGIGGGRERPMTHEQFNAELAELRDRTTAKRARNGLG